MFEIIMMLIGTFTFSIYTYKWSWAFVSSRWDLKHPRLVELELAWMPLLLMTLLQLNWPMLIVWAGGAIAVLLWYLWKIR